MCPYFVSLLCTTGLMQQHFYKQTKYCLRTKKHVQPVWQILWFWLMKQIWTISVFAYPSISLFGYVYLKLNQLLQSVGLILGGTLPVVIERMQCCCLLYRKNAWAGFIQSPLCSIWMNVVIVLRMLAAVNWQRHWCFLLAYLCTSGFCVLICRRVCCSL